MDVKQAHRPQTIHIRLSFQLILARLITKQTKLELGHLHICSVYIRSNKFISTSKIIGFLNARHVIYELFV